MLTTLLSKFGTKVAFAVGCVVVLSFLYHMVYSKGYDTCKDEVNKAVIAAQQEASKKTNEIIQKTNSLSDTQLNDELSRWMQ